MIVGAVVSGGKMNTVVSNPGVVFGRPVTVKVVAINPSRSRRQGKWM
jgi:hypothetical protein